MTYIVREPRLIRPLNYPILADAPGRGSNLFETQDGKRIVVINLLGRVHMDALDDPFAAVDRELDKAPLGMVADAVVVDMHAEATSEKMAMGHFCDGRASLVVGTHTHVPTADARVLPGGTAFISDVGMTGARNSILGVEVEDALGRFVTQMPARFRTAEDDVWINAVVVDVGADGSAEGIEQVLRPAS
jgi:metallophosphoesterase (TIGR00282 family)